MIRTEAEMREDLFYALCAYFPRRRRSMRTVRREMVRRAKQMGATKPQAQAYARRALTELRDRCADSEVTAVESWALVLSEEVPV